MKQFILIFFIIIFSILLYSYEFQVFYNSGSNNIYTEITGYRDSVFYQIYTDTMYNPDGEVYLKYTVGDGTIQSSSLVLSTAGNIGRRGVIASDTMGKCAISWIETNSNITKVIYAMCSDTQLILTYNQTIDSVLVTLNQFFDNTSIAISEDGSNVALVYNKVFYTLSGDSVIIDSTYLYYSVSSDSGKVFLAPVKINETSNLLIDPDISIGDSTIYIVYTAENSGSYYLNECIVNYPYTSADQQIITWDTTLYNFHPSIVSRGDSQFVAYENFNALTNAVNIKVLNISDTVFIDSIFMYEESEEQRFPNLTLLNNLPFITYYRILGDGPGLFYATWDINFSQFNVDWVAGIGNYADFYCKSDAYIFNDQKFYITLPFYNASGSYTYIESAKPDLPPSEPYNITVNGDSVSYWTSNPDFHIEWTLPNDLSEIFKTYYKLYLSPISDTDTMGSTDPLYSYLDINEPNLGIDSVFMWCMDYRGNIDYRNHGIALLKYDTTKPNQVAKIYPANLDTIYTRSIDFIYHSGFDLVSGIKQYRAGFGRDSSYFDLDTFLIDTQISVDTSMLYFPFSDGVYYWNVIAIDSADNDGVLSANYAFYIKATPNVQLLYPNNGDTVSNPSDYIYTGITDYNSDVSSYEIQFARDPFFDDIIFDTVYGWVSEDTIFTYSFSYEESLYWRVRWVNTNNYRGEFSPPYLVYFDKNSINTDSLDFEFDYLPYSVIIGSDVQINLRITKPEVSFDGSFILTDIGDTIDIDFVRDSTYYNEDGIYVFSTNFNTVGLSCSSFDVYVYVSDGINTVFKQSGDILIEYPADWVDETMFLVWPNPVKGDVLNINTTVYRNTDIQVDIYDMRGNKIRQIYDSALSGEFKTLSIDIASLEQDLYFGVITYSCDGEIRKDKFRFVKIK